ncbi:MAG: hypothetical protein L3V56_12220 [Candidatus Magnetoovum sp. WYHC-5]|nr:hypothetical protein [Candidatus Magnetoovum sp. WYHC-5]
MSAKKDAIIKRGTPINVGNKGSILTSPFLYLSLFSLYVIIQVLFGERIPVNGGLGWDGIEYARYSRDYFNEITKNRHEFLISYEALRSLPFLVVYIIHKVLFITPTDEALIQIWRVMNGFMIILSLYLFVCSLMFHGIERRYQILGLTLFFLNFIVSKHLIYYSIQTDAIALFLSSLSLFLYLRGKAYLLLLTTLFASFSWPIGGMMNLLLLLFPYKKDAPSIPFKLYGFSEQALSKFRWSFEDIRIRLFMAFIGTYVLMAFAYIIIYFFNFAVPWQPPIPVFKPLAPVGLFIFCCYFFMVFYYFLSLSPFKTLAHSIKIRSIVLFVLAYVLIYLIKVLFLKGYLGLHELRTSTEHTITSVFMFLSYHSAKPGGFIVGNAVGFGLIFMLFIVHMDKFFEALYEHYYQMAFMVILSVLITMGPTSREMIYNFPFVAFIIIIALAKMNYSGRELAVFYVMAFIASKIWYSLPTDIDYGNFGIYSFIGWPVQHYFMNFAESMSWNTYAVQGIIFLIFMAELIRIRIKA